MSALAAFTLFHVALSLVGIVAGFVAMFGWLRQQALDRWTLVFLASTLATSLTGFLFPFVQFLPSHAVGIVSTVIVPVALLGRYRYRLAGRWRWLYTVSAVAALYLNTFVLVVQLFLKVPALHALAPTQTEPAFLAAQLATLAFFIWLGVATTFGSKRASVRAASDASLV